MLLGDRLVRTRSVALVFALAVIVAACGSSAPTPTPAPPTAAPTPTPDPHLTAPASVDRVYSELRKAGLEIIANTAEAGKEPVKTLNLTYEAWPLLLEEFTTADQIPAYTRFDPKKKPAFGQPPYAFAGLNIYVAFGPLVQNSAPTAPGPRFVDAAARLAAVLDPLLGPLEQSSVTLVPMPGPTASPSPTPTPKPTPTKKPKPTRKPKPTKRP